MKYILLSLLGTLSLQIQMNLNMPLDQQQALGQSIDLSSLSQVSLSSPSISNSPSLFGVNALDNLQNQYMSEQVSQERA